MEVTNNGMPVLFIQPMTTRLLATQDQIAANLKAMDKEALYNAAHNYSVVLTKDKTIGMIHNIDVFEDDVNDAIDELRAVYDDDMINSIKSTREQITMEINGILDVILENYWKCDMMRVVCYHDASITNRFHEILYSVLQESFVIHNQETKDYEPNQQTGMHVIEYSYTISKHKENNNGTTD